MIVTTVGDTDIRKDKNDDILFGQEGKRKRHRGGPINSLNAVWPAWATYFTTQDDGIK